MIFNYKKTIILLVFSIFVLNSCGSLPGGDARNNPPDPKKELQKLQRVQNTAARLVVRSRKYDHISPVLRDLHWLPVKKRIDYKILLIVYKAINNSCPSYITELLSLKKMSRNLRSNHNTTLTVPRFATSTYGERAFSVAVPKLWNSLPCKIRPAVSTGSFKTQLKTFLFTDF